MRNWKIFLLLCCMLQTAVWAAPWKIVPGSGVGPLTIGGDWKTFDPMLTREKVIQDSYAVKWASYKEGIELHLDKGRVLQIIVHNPSAVVKGAPVELEAEGGIRVGSTVQQMEQAYGRNYTAQDLIIGKHKTGETYYVYPSRGIGFIAKGGQISQISVWPRKG